MGALTALGLPVLLAAPSGAATYVVTTTADVLDAGDGLVSLREAVIAANGTAADDTVVLASGATYPLTLCTADPGDTGTSTDLDHVGSGGSLTIEGNGATIDQQCDFKDGIIEHNSTGSTSRLTLRDLVLTGVHGPNTTVVDAEDRLTVERVHFVGNWATYAIDAGWAADDAQILDSVLDGAPSGQTGINAHNQHVTISNTTIRGFVQRGVIVDASANLHVQDSRFLANSGGSGGAIVASGPVDVSGSTFVGNSGAAGAIRMTGAPLEVDSSTFSQNTSSSTGAAITSDHDVELAHTTLYANTHTSGAPANLATTATLTSFASIVGQPTAGASCVVAATVSQGFNLENGTSCGFTATDDRGGLSSVHLGPLEVGDHPDERVRMPRFPSVAVDLIPIGSCVGTIVDQAGRLRPTDGDFDGDAECDAGAVELPLRPVFTDVSASHPFFEEIGWMGWQGISTGSQPGPTYKPSDPVSRQAMSAFLYRLAGSPAFTDPAAPTFADVSKANPFFTEIEWMDAEGITTGFPGGLFKPLAPVSRQSMSAFMHRMAGAPAGPFPDPGFTDVGPGHPFVLEIRWMADAGVTTGFPGPPLTYQPSRPVSRQAMAAFMQRFAPLL